MYICLFLSVQFDVTAPSAVGALYLQCSFSIGRIRPCDQNTIMAASAVVRSGMGLTLRLSRGIPDCSTCVLSRMNSCVNAVANLQRIGSFDSFRTINRHLQTSIGKHRILLVAAS